MEPWHPPAKVSTVPAVMSFSILPYSFRKFGSAAGRIQTMKCSLSWLPMPGYVSLMNWTCGPRQHVTRMVWCTTVRKAQIA